jgi:hypothetical protein
MTIIGGALSKLSKLRLSAFSALQKVRSRIHPNTFRAYERKLYAVARKDIAEKLLKEIQLIDTPQAQAVNKIISSIDIKKLKKQPVVKVKSEVISDRFKFYTRKLFVYQNDGTERGLYQSILDAYNRNKSYTAVVLYAGSQNSYTGKVRHFQLGISYVVGGFDMFMNEVNGILTGNNTYGSDAFDESDEGLDTSAFSLIKLGLDGGGKSDKMMFKVQGIESSKGECAKLCLESILGEELKLDAKEIKKLACVEGLIEYIESKFLPISLMCNSFTLKSSHNKIVERDNLMKDVIVDKKKNITRKMKCGKIELGDVKIVYLHKSKSPTATIIYDEFNKHFDIITDNKVEMLDNIFISLESKIIKGDEVLFAPRQMNINNQSIKKTDAVNSKFVVFDYETIIDFKKSSCMREYSLSILVLTDAELEELTKADEQNNIDAVERIRKRCCITFLGYDCSQKFIEWVIKNQLDTIFTFIGFNNVNFDNFILLDAILRCDTEGIGASEIFYNGSQLLNFKINGRHSTFDIHKHLMGSLSANCKSFKINCCAKKSFDHNKAQLLHEEGELIDFITDNEELKEYNEFDVLATAVLFCKYRRALSKIEATAGYAKDLHQVKTIGSLIYKVFEEKKYKFPKIDYKQYSDLQKYKIAGRVELFNGVQKVEERLVSTDVCSLYPYVMSVAPVYYPCGDVKNTETYQGADVIGFYYCDIDQSNLKALNLPKIYARKTEIENDWGHEEVLENYLISNVIIELLLKFGCKVVIKNGFYFTERKKSCDMFDFILDFMKAKNEQDTFSKNKNPEYNPALRETLKLLMNSLSGKVIEGLHTEKTIEVNNVAEYMKIKDKAQSINFINVIGNKLFLTYEVDGESICERSQRPIYLGVLVYDYAKRYMYENSYSKVGLDALLYTDTDASKFRYSRFLEWKQEIDSKNIQVPCWDEVKLVDPRYNNHKIYEANSKVFGSFEDELSGMTGENYTFYCVEKKSWCYSVDGDSKFRFKGLNGSALLLSLGEDFVEKRIICHQDGDEEIRYRIAKNCEKQVYMFANNNKQLAIENNNQLKFFETIYSSGEAYVLCCSFRKIVKNSSRNVIYGQEDKYNNLMNKVQVNYMIKRIKISI